MLFLFHAIFSRVDTLGVYVFETRKCCSTHLLNQDSVPVVTQRTKCTRAYVCVDFLLLLSWYYSLFLTSLLLMLLMQLLHLWLASVPKLMCVYFSCMEGRTKISAYKQHIYIANSERDQNLVSDQRKKSDRQCVVVIVFFSAFSFLSYSCSALYSQLHLPFHLTTHQATPCLTLSYPRFHFISTNRTQTHAASRFAAIGLYVYWKQAHICSTLFDATPTKCIVIAFITSITKGSSRRRKRPFGSEYKHCFTSCDHFACLWMITYVCLWVFAIIFAAFAFSGKLVYTTAYISNTTLYDNSSSLACLRIFSLLAR